MNLKILPAFWANQRTILIKINVYPQKFAGYHYCCKDMGY